MVIMLACHAKVRSSILLGTAKFDAGRSSDPAGLISLTESGALPLPATSFIPQNPSKVHGLDC